MKALFLAMVVFMSGCWSTTTRNATNKNANEHTVTTETVPVVVNGTVQSFTKHTETTRVYSEDIATKSEAVSKADVSALIAAAGIAANPASVVPSLLGGLFTSPEGIGGGLLTLAGLGFGANKLRKRRAVLIGNKAEGDKGYG